MGFFKTIFWGQFQKIFAKVTPYHISIFFKDKFIKKSNWHPFTNMAELFIYLFISCPHVTHVAMTHELALGTIESKGDCESQKQ